MNLNAPQAYIAIAIWGVNAMGARVIQYSIATTAHAITSSITATITIGGLIQLYTQFPSGTPNPHIPTAVIPISDRDTRRYVNTGSLILKTLRPA